MSCKNHHSSTPGIPIYISTVEVMLSSSRMIPSQARKSAAWCSRFQKMPPAEILSDSAWYFPAHLSSAETLPRNNISPPGCISSVVYSSRLDIVLAHTSKENDSGKDNSYVNPSGIRSTCPVTPCNSFGSASAPSHLISCKPCSGSPWSPFHSSTDCMDPKQLAASLPATASRALPCWTSRLDVALCSIPRVLQSHSKNLHTALKPCSAETTQHGYSRCSGKLSDLHASVKLYISTCSITIKPFRTASHASSHVYSSLLLPQLKKFSSTSSDCPTESQMTRRTIPSAASEDLHITQFHVTSTASPGPPQQAVSREIQLSPTTSKGDHSVGQRPASSGHLDPDLVVFQNPHSSGKDFERTSSPGIIPTHHNVSKITLIVATPWTSIPIQVIREFRKSPASSILIRTSGTDTVGPPFHTGDVASGFSLSINPVCCPELLPSQQCGTNSESKSFQELSTVTGNAEQETLATTVQASSPNSASHRAGESAWCPSISVKIASFGPERKVVKIFIPF